MANPYYIDPYKKPEEEIVPFKQDKPGVIPTPSTLKGRPAGEVKPVPPQIEKEILEADSETIGTRAAWCGMPDAGWTES